MGEYRDLVHTHGGMGRFTMEIGWIIRCMEGENAFGGMGNRIRGNIRMIWRMDMGHSLGGMESNMKGNGRMGNNMGKEL